jgi:hypothetical protein
MESQVEDQREIKIELPSTSLGRTAVCAALAPMEALAQLFRATWRWGDGRH